MSMKMNFQKRENFSDILDDQIMKMYLVCTLVSHQTQSLFRGNEMTKVQGLFLNLKMVGAEDGSAVKSTHCSCRGWDSTPSTLKVTQNCL